MRLFLARHGETVENAKGISQGHWPGTFSKKGLQQAKELALKLKSEKIDAIYSSDLKRAANTAREIARFHPNAEILFIKSLREVDLKKLAGTKIDWEKDRPTGIESHASMAARARQALEQAFSVHPNGSVLFVAHHGINKSIMRIIHNWPLDKKIPPLENASLQAFEIKKGEDGKFFLKEN